MNPDVAAESPLMGIIHTEERLLKATGERIKSAMNVSRREFQSGETRNKVPFPKKEPLNSRSPREDITLGFSAPGMVTMAFLLSKILIL